MDLDLNLRLKCVTLNIFKKQEPAINLLHFIKIFWVCFRDYNILRALWFHDC
jgi:hypothetical protein